MTQLSVDHAGDEVVAVVVALMSVQVQRLTGRGASRLQALGLQLAGQKAVAETLVDADRAIETVTVGQQRTGVGLTPGDRILAQIARQGLLPPGHFDGCADRRQRRQ